MHENEKNNYHNYEEKTWEEKMMRRKRISILVGLVTVILSVVPIMGVQANGDLSETFKLSTEYDVSEIFFIKAQEEGKINKGDLIISRNGIERVYCINEKGEFYSEQIEDMSRVTQNCEHPFAKLQYKTRYNTRELVGTTATCYKRYEVTVYQCLGCMRNVTKTRHLETVSKHTYKILGKTCTVCGYQK